MYSYVASTFYLKMKGKFYLVPSYLLPNKAEFITKSYTPSCLEWLALHYLMITWILPCRSWLAHNQRTLLFNTQEKAVFRAVCQNQ